MKTSSSAVVFMYARVPLYQAKAELFRTLGHPARIRILELLSERDHAVLNCSRGSPLNPAISPNNSPCCACAMVVSHRNNGEVIYSVSVPRSARSASWPLARSCLGSSRARAN